MQFYWLLACYLQVLFIQFNVKGISISIEVKLSCKDVMCVIMTKYISTNPDINLSEQIMKWYHDNIFMLCICTVNILGTPVE